MANTPSLPLLLDVGCKHLCICPNAVCVKHSCLLLPRICAAVFHTNSLMWLIWMQICWEAASFRLLVWERGIVGFDFENVSERRCNHWPVKLTVHGVEKWHTATEAHKPVVCFFQTKLRWIIVWTEQPCCFFKGTCPLPVKKDVDDHTIEKVPEGDELVSQRQGPHSRQREVQDSS